MPRLEATGEAMHIKTTGLQEDHFVISIFPKVPATAADGFREERRDWPCCLLASLDRATAVHPQRSYLSLVSRARRFLLVWPARLISAYSAAT